MKKILLLAIFSMLFTICSNCGKNNNNNNNENGNKEKTKNQNIIVLLDLSNRIFKTNQIERDKKIIAKLFDAFEKENLRRVLTAKDIFTVTVASQKDSKVNFSAFEGNLSIKMHNLKGDQFKEKKKALFESIDKLYEEAVNSPTPGADIYNFFKDNLKIYLKPAKDYNNKLVILTDGYLSFDQNIASERPKGTQISYADLNLLRKRKDWERLLEEKKIKLDSFPLETENLQVLMLEMNPENSEVNTNEIEILKKIWQVWFEDLNIYDTAFFKREAQVEALESPIQDFLKKKNLLDRMEEPLVLKGQLYKSHILENNEIVKGLKGKYLVIDIRDIEEKEPIYFPTGKYVIENPPKYQNAIDEFGKAIVEKLSRSKKKINYEIFVKGSADILGEDSFRGNFVPNYTDSYKEICFLKRYKDADYLFITEQSCSRINEPFLNKDLPNLRAMFLKELFDNYYGESFNARTKILEGSVADFISGLQRSATLILYLPENFFKE